jgi:epoxyqueuosine reductase
VLTDQSVGVASDEILTVEAQTLGFPLCGTAPLAPLPRAPFLRDWVAEGRAGEMAYLATRFDERADPRVLAPWARSLITLAFPYRPPPPPPRDWRQTLRGRIAAYALGVDYHGEVRRRLRALADRLRARLPGARFATTVDTGALVEREWGARGGLGWIGRNTLVLHRALGSYFFLAEMFTDLDLPAVALPDDHCGTCMRCVSACPTGALEQGYTMDPRRCLSYLTIEHRSAIPPSLRPALDNWIFGCDVCQEVCPWNGGHDPDGATFLTPHLPTLLALDEAAFRARFGTTAVRRAGRRNLLRNVAVALGNSANPDAVAPLRRALTDPEPLVRAHVAWALGRLGTTAARHALDTRRSTEPDPSVRSEIDAALGERPLH